MLILFPNRATGIASTSQMSSKKKRKFHLKLTKALHLLFYIYILLLLPKKY